MTIDRWISDRTTDSFIIEDEDGKILYDARRTMHEPAPYIMESLITDEYTCDGIIILAI